MRHIIFQAILGEGNHSEFPAHNYEQRGSIIFDNLPIIFAVGVAIGMAKKEKEVALAAMISFFVMNATMNAMLLIRGDLLADGTLGAGVLEGTDMRLRNPDITDGCIWRYYRWTWSSSTS